MVPRTLPFGKPADPPHDALPTTALRSMSKIIEEIPCHTSGSSGIAFDSERTVDGQFQVKSRIAFIPVTGGFVQITLTTPKGEFRNRQMDLSRFLNSFRVVKLKAT